MSLYRLVRRCPPLDVNSPYLYMLLGEHHSATCVAARMDDRVVGLVSAYLLPADPRTLFVWQVAVHPGVRGRGLGGEMLDALLARPAVAGIHRLQTSVSPTNTASNRMFDRLAERRGATVRRSPFLAAEAFGEETHEEEVRLTLEPIINPHSRKGVS